MNGFVPVRFPCRIMDLGDSDVGLGGETYRGATESHSHCSESLQLFHFSDGIFAKHDCRATRGTGISDRLARRTIATLRLDAANALTGAITANARAPIVPAA